MNAIRVPSLSLSARRGLDPGYFMPTYTPPLTIEKRMSNKIKLHHDAYYKPKDPQKCPDYRFWKSAHFIRFVDNDFDRYSIHNAVGDYLDSSNIFDEKDVDLYCLKTNTTFKVGEKYCFNYIPVNSPIAPKEPFQLDCYESHSRQKADFIISHQGAQYRIKDVDISRVFPVERLKTKPLTVTNEIPIDPKNLTPLEEMQPPAPLTKPDKSIIGQDHIKNYVSIAAKENMAMLLIGDTGSGKTSIIREEAKANKKELIRINLTGETTVDELIGKYVLKDEQTIWEDGVLITALKKGQWFLLDEINAALPEILFVLHSLLDDDKHVRLQQKDGEVVKAHKNFRFFATMNPVEEYAGTKELNKAFMSRFPISVTMEYPSQPTETEIVYRHTLIDYDLAHKISLLGHEIRKAKGNSDIFYTCSTRDLVQFAELTKHLPLTEAFEVSMYNKANPEDRETLRGISENILGQELKAPTNPDTLGTLHRELMAHKSALELREAKLATKEKDLEAKAEQLKDHVIRQVAEHLVDQADDSKIEVPDAPAEEQLSEEDLPF